MAGMVLTRSLERDVHSGVLRRDCERVLHSLRSLGSWHIRSSASQLSQVLLPTIEYVHSIIPGVSLIVYRSVNLFQGLNYLGVPTEFDPNDGTSAGAAFVPTDLDPDNQTRSDARRTYYDPYAQRPNMHVIIGQHVTRILIEGIGSNIAVTNPTAGGNQNGEGTTNGNPNGFGFGPSADTPPLGGQTSNRFVRREDPSSASLRVTGVEVCSLRWLVAHGG